MNKTYNNSALAALLALSVSGVAQAESRFQPYIGLDISNLSANYQSSNGINYDEVLEDSLLALNPYVGVQLHERIGVEVGYLRSEEGDKSLDAARVLGTSGVDANTELTISGFHADVVVNHPLTDKLDLLGSVGIAQLEADLTLTVASGTASAEASDDESDTALRFGLGGRYALTDQLGIRGMLRYMNVDFDSTSDNLMQYSIGLSYQF